MLKLSGDGRGELEGGLEITTLVAEGGSATRLPDRECPEVLLGGVSELTLLELAMVWPSWEADASILRRSAMEGPDVG